MARYLANARTKNAEVEGWVNARDVGDLGHGELLGVRDKSVLLPTKHALNNISLDTPKHDIYRQGG